MSGSSDNSCSGGDYEDPAQYSDGVVSVSSPEPMLSFSSLAAALERIEATAAGASEGERAAAVAPLADSERTPEDEVLCSDRQLVLALRTLSDAHGEHLRAIAQVDNGGNTELGNVGSATGTGTSGGLTFAEFLHCYRTVIAGMQAMHRMPHRSGFTSSEENATTADNESKGTGRGKKARSEVDDPRAKTRERTLSAVRLFGPSGGSSSSSSDMSAARTTKEQSDDGHSSTGIVGGKKLALTAVVAAAAIALAMARASSSFSGGTIDEAAMQQLKDPMENQETQFLHSEDLSDVTAARPGVSTMASGSIAAPNTLVKGTRMARSKQVHPNTLSDLVPTDKRMLENSQVAGDDSDNNASGSLGENGDKTSAHASGETASVRSRRRQSLNAALGGAALAAFLSSLPAMAPHSLVLAAAAAGISALMNAGGTARKVSAWVKFVLEWAVRKSAAGRRRGEA